MSPNSAGRPGSAVARSVTDGPWRLDPFGVLGRRTERDPDLHAGADPGRRLEHGVAAVRGRDRPHDGQPEPAAVGVLAIVAAAVEAVERARLRLGVHALARVGHL